MRPLQDLGASAVADRVYASLVRRGRQPIGPLASSLAESPYAVRAAVDELQELRLVSRCGEEVIPLSPRAAIETLAEGRARGAATARQSAETLGALWAAHVDGPPYVEMLTTTDAVQAAALAIHEHAAAPVRALSIGPVGLVEPVDAEPQVAPGVMDALARGVAYRVVYGAEILRHPLAVAAVSRCLAAGEQARVLPDVPLNLTIGDTYAILVMGASGTERLHAMVVHPSDLHDRLVGLFEVFWGLALPISPAVEATGPTASDPGSRRLLTLLAAGLTDESIARELGVSERTVARRIVVLQRALGAQGRFQLGVQAIRHGLL